MHRLRVIDRSGNTLRLQRGGKAIAIGALRQADGVLRPHRGTTAGEPRNTDNVAEPLAVAFRHFVTGGDFIVEDLQLFNQDRGLHRVEPPREPEPNVVVFVRALAVNPDAAQRVGELVVVGQDRPAIAEASERFGGKKAGRGSKSRRAEPTALVAGAKGLRGVIEHE